VLRPNSTTQTPLNGSFLFAIHAKVKHYHQNNVLKRFLSNTIGYTNNIGISRDFTYEGWSWTHHHPLWWFRLYIPLINAHVFINVSWTQEKVTINPNQGIRVV
jgi:hypothetical protein